MVIALFDTNILIDYLNGVETARGELDKYDDQAISVITWMEVMAGATPATDADIQGFLDTFIQIPLDNKIAAQAVTLRRTHRIKLPDAIVWASARLHAMLLVTRNSKDFPHHEPGVRIPY